MTLRTEMKLQMQLHSIAWWEEKEERESGKRKEERGKVESVKREGEGERGK